MTVTILPRLMKSYVTTIGFSVPSGSLSPHDGNNNRQTDPTGGGNDHLAEDWADVEARQGAESGGFVHRQRRLLPR